MDGLIQHSETINKLLARYGVKFGIYKNGEFKEQLFPFDNMLFEDAVSYSIVRNLLRNLISE